MPSLLFPLGLAALAAWLLPLLLHLVRREREDPVPFAALRWLRAKPHPRRRLRFEEWPLLLLRLLLLAALALLLARPVFDGGGETRRVVLLHPSLAAATVATGDDVRWLAPGFAPTTQPAPESAAPVASLLREIDATLPAGATLQVHVPAVLDGADGETPRLSRAVDWQAHDGAPSLSPPLPPAAIPRLVVRAGGDHADDARWLRGARAAWRHAADSVAADDAGAAPPPAQSEVTPAPAADLDAGDTLPGADHVLAWLYAGPVPDDVAAWVRGGGTLLLPQDAALPSFDIAEDAARDVAGLRDTTDVDDARHDDGPAADADDAPDAPASASDDAGAVLWRDDDGQALLRATPTGAGRVLQWQVALRPDTLPALLDAGFPRRLRTLLQPAPAAPTRAPAAALAPREGGAAFVLPPRPLDTPLVWLVLTLFAVERLLATRRRERAA